MLTGIENTIFYNVRINDEDELSSAWKSINASDDLIFAGDTTTSDNATLAMTPPVWPDEADLLATSSDAERATPFCAAKLSWDEAEDASGYIIETYVDGESEPVDITEPVTGTSTVIRGSGVIRPMSMVPW